MNGYFDTASSSFPKPEAVAEAMSHHLLHEGGTYGRAAYGRVVQSTAAVEACRDAMGQLLGTTLTENICFTANATTAANALFKGIDPPQIVWISPLEHNAVMRPLQYLADRHGTQIRVLPHGAGGLIDSEALRALDPCEADLVVVNHQSNVNGVIQPLEAIKRWASSTPLLVDTAQSLGNILFEADRWGIDYLIFTGHKGLLGPTGVGGFFARNTESLTPYTHGGTGSRSESYLMPEQSPDRFEAGTPNIVGLVGLLAALKHRPQPKHSPAEFRSCMESVGALAGIELFAAPSSDTQGELFSVRHATIGTAELAHRLYTEGGIETRQGLHCAPLAHRTLGTSPTGTVRFSFSPYHTPADLNNLIDTLHRILTR